MDAALPLTRVRLFCARRRPVSRCACAYVRVFIQLYGRVYSCTQRGPRPTNYIVYREYNGISPLMYRRPAVLIVCRCVHVSVTASAGCDLCVQGTEAKSSEQRSPENTAVSEITSDRMKRTCTAVRTPGSEGSRSQDGPRHAGDQGDVHRSEASELGRRWLAHAECEGCTLRPIGAQRP